jgi:hypothetical protein
LDLKKLDPKPLIVHKKRLTDMKKSKIVLEAISSSRLSAKSPAKDL